MRLEDEVLFIALAVDVTVKRKRKSLVLVLAWKTSEATLPSPDLPTRSFIAGPRKQGVTKATAPAAVYRGRT